MDKRSSSLSSYSTTSSSYNLTYQDFGSFFQAYCASPPDDSCDYGFCPNPDTTSLGVRVSSYVTNVCMAILIKYSPKDAVEVFPSQMLTIYSLLVSPLIAIPLHQLTLNDATFVLADAVSPLTMYLVVHAYQCARAHGRRTKLDYLFGPGRLKNRFLIMLIGPIWLAYVLLLLVPAKSIFLQPACNSKLSPAEIIISSVVWPVTAVFFIFDASPTAIIMIIPLLAWCVATVRLRKEIWGATWGEWFPYNRKKWFPWRRMWTVVVNRHPLLEFLVVIIFPHSVWILTLESYLLGTVTSSNSPFPLTYAQLLAIFVAVPPILSLLRLLSRLRLRRIREAGHGDTSPKRMVKLVVIADINCPWCYINHRALMGAVSRCEDLPITFDIEYRPFCIEPDLSVDTPRDKAEHYWNRFGPEKYRAVQKIISDLAVQVGAKIVWAGMMTQTTRAHRLLRKAWKIGGHESQLLLVEQLFKGYFEDQKDIGNSDTLASIVRDTGIMSKQDALAFLATNECEKEITDMISETKRMRTPTYINDNDATVMSISGVPFMGISRVPLTIIDGKLAVSGVQTTEMFLQIFKRIGTPMLRGSHSDHAETLHFHGWRDS